jgi:hypothetical protein
VSVLGTKTPLSVDFNSKIAVGSGVLVPTPTLFCEYAIVKDKETSIINILFFS